MVFEAGSDNLPFVKQVFGTDKADNTVDEKRVEGARDPVGSCFQGQLIDSVMRFGGERTALAGFEVHDVVACPSDIVLPLALAMVVENLFTAIAQHVQVIPKLRLAD